MPCPTCDHSMAVTCTNSTEICIQCPRCGTVTINSTREPSRIIAVHVPALVERCRAFIAEVGDDKKHCRGFFPVDIKQHWHRLGLSESIHTPEKRSSRE